MSHDEARRRRGEKIGVMVVDDHPMWREAVGRDLEAVGFELVGTAGDGSQALRIVGAVLPDVVVCDLHLPDMPGFEVTREILAAHPWMRVLVLSASGEQADVLEAVKAGATGYLVKSASSEELHRAVAATARGEAVFTPGLAGLVLGEFRRMAKEDSTPSLLSEREVEILRLVAKGLSAKHIASRLFLSVRTVENHTQSVLRKLQLHNRVELTRYAIEQGLDQE